MPKGARGSRGKSKGRPNFVRLGIKCLQAPKGTTKEELKKILTESINGDYSLPAGFVVQIGWSNNRETKEMKYDEWTNALIDSSTYGRGWDKLLLRYLDLAG